MGILRRQSSKPKAKKEREVEKSRRILEGNQKKIVSVIAILFAAYQIYVNSFSNIPSTIRNAYHLGFLLVLAFLLYPARKKSPQNRFTVVDIVLAVLGAAAGVYLAVNFDIIHVQRGSIAITRDYVFAVITILLLLEASRRTMGNIIPGLAILFLIYAKYGRYFPGMFAHGGFYWKRILYRMYLTYEGIFGITLSVSATYIFLFILFGAFLRKSGATEFFNDLSLALAGKKRGGPAQVAVVSSGLMGTLSGSAVANVATTGSVTIPMMKSIGYKPHFAGAVEAAASTGGMIMPPIMGAAAFIMATFLEVPYLRIIMAGIIPAILYYAGISISVDLEAKRLGLKGLDASKIPNLLDVIKQKGLLIIPLIVIIYTLVSGRSALYAGFAGIISTILVASLKKETRMGIKDILGAMEEASYGAIQVGIACATCGIIVGVAGMTGIGSVLAHNIIQLSGGILFIALLAVMAVAIILSMGLPSTALYIVVAVTAAPALVELGVAPIAAHMFVFWFGAMSNVTPPVALASYTGAGIAGADPMKTGWTGLKLTLAGFLIPFMFAYNPVIVWEGASILTIIRVFITGFIGVYALAVAVQNYMNDYLKIYERIVFFAGALLMMHPGAMTDLIGIVVLIIAFATHHIRVKNKKKAQTEKSENDNM
ncbi:MAG: hypothetical protein PWP21_1264 [Thermosediminibacterales bacterium]|nr:hypothetical protein [Thermosediminibacterales bacterium]